MNIDKMKFNPSKKLISSFVSAATLLVIAPSASAQLEEIVVTATKRVESLQSVPITVTAFTEKGLKDRGIESSADIGDFIPNVQFDTSSSFAGTDTFQAYIRGIGQSDFAINTDPGVAVYVDGVYYARASSSVVDLLDVERIEVLKGPQGTLFGRNSIGGALSITTKTPSEESTGSVDVTAGEFGRFDINAAFNFPLSETLFSSVAVSNKSRDGFQTRIPFPGANTGGGGPRLDQILATGSNNSEDELGGIDSQSFRGKLLWEYSDNVRVTFAADYNRSRNDATPTTLLNAEENLDTPGGLAGLFNLCVAQFAPVAPICNTSPFLADETLPFDNRFLTDDIDTTFGNGANFSNDDSFGLSATVEWDLNDNFTLKSITAYREIDSEFGLDIDGSPTIFDQTTFTIDQSQFSQEYQLNGDIGNTKFTVGALYFTEDASQADNVPIAGGLLQISGDNSQDVTSLSLFGEASYRVNDSVNLVAGIRFTDEEKELQLNQQNLNPDFFIATGFPVPFFPREDFTFLGPEELQEADFTNTSVRLGANWQITDDLFTYATFSQGFKSGGFTTRLTAPFNPLIGLNGLTDLEFDEETVDSFEIGFKSEFLNNTVRVNGAFFFNSYEDIQIVVQRGITPANENAGEAEIQGFELELEALLSDSLTLTGAFGFQDAEYTELDPLLATTDFGAFDINAELPNTPEVTANAAINWVAGRVANGELALNLNVSFTDDVFNDTENTALLFQDSSSIWGASVAWVSDNEQWDARLGVSNFTDERRLVSGFNAGALNFVTGSFNRPREWFLSVGYKY